MKRPNFFIVGAPKCGTTALSEYLRSHPDIFLCDPKEPHYFSEDMDQHRYVKKLDSYLDLFQHAAEDKKIIGEASVGYLFSDVALSNIYNFNPNAKIIAMVRNPIEAAISSHRQLLYARYENEPDFENAWRLQASRKLGQNIPSTCRAPAFLQYADACRFGRQIERLMRTFPDKQIKVIVFDDFISDTAKVYREVLDFLELPHDGRDSFPRINEAKQPRSEWMARWISASKPLAVRLGMRFRALTGVNLLPLMRKALVLNEDKALKTGISEAFHRELAESYREDVALLSTLLKRDLSSWLVKP